MSAALGAGNLRRQTLQSEPPVIQAGQGVNHSQVAQYVGMALLFGELTAKALDEDLLIDGVDVEDDYQGE